MSTQPRQLPARPRVFVDRSDELALLRADARAAVADGVPLLRVIGGPEGIGKSTLGARVGHEIAELYPDGQLYYDLRGSEAELEVSAATIAAFFLRQLGVDGDEIPADPAERLTALRSLLADRRVLVLLDDVATANQVAPLLFESPANALLVTTRRPLTALRAHGFTTVELKPFGDDEAHELLATMAGDRVDGLEPGVLRRMRELCEGLPLALSIAGTRLGALDESPADYLCELQRAEPHELLELDGDRPVLRIFDTTYREMAADEARAYALVSVLPGPDFGVDVAAEVLGLDRTAATRVLRGLTNRYVLSRDHAGRYRFHGLVRAHARDRARAAFPPMELAATVNTARWWYWRRQVALDKTFAPRPVPLGAEAYYDAIEPAFTGADAERRAWAETESEWPNLLAAMTADADWPEDKLTKIFPLPLWFFGYQTGHCADLVDAYLRALTTGPDAGEAWQLYRDLAGLHERCGNADEADECVALALRTGYVPGTASVYEWHGLTQENRGDHARARDALMRAVEAVPLMENPAQAERAQALLSMHLGRVHRKLDELDRAEAELSVACDYFASSGEPVNQARAELDLGRTVAQTGRHREAVEPLEAAFAEFQARSMRSKGADAAEELARIADLDGRRDDARHWHAVAAELRG